MLLIIPEIFSISILQRSNYNCKYPNIDETTPPLQTQMIKKIV